jgi:hypothetical protein
MLLAVHLVTNSWPDRHTKQSLIIIIILLALQPIVGLYFASL